MNTKQTNQIDQTNQTALEIAHGVRSGQTSAVDVTRQHLRRIADLDSELGAFQLVRSAAALEEAAEIDRRSDRGSLPLAGVPVAIKDNVDVAGEPTRHGSAGTRQAPAERDDELVRRLRDAGCVVVGKTRMPELAVWAMTSSAAFGVTRSPWDLTHDPGGSTGGGAVAVASGMAALALGTDGGGSLRIPAAYCGVVGFKPATGVLPLPGNEPEHWYGLTASGPLARTVADAAAMLAVLSGHGDVPEAVGTTALRVAVSLKSPSPIGRADAHNRAAVESGERELSERGHRVARADPPYSPLLISRWTRRWHAGVADDARRLSQDLEPRTRTIAAKGRRVQRLGGPRPEVAARWRDRAIAWLEDYDVLLTPVVAGPAPKAGSMTGKGYLATLQNAAANVPFTQAWNLAGLSAIAVPTGVVGDRPTAVQLIVKPGDAAKMWALGAELENYTRPPDRTPVHLS